MEKEPFFKINREALEKENQKREELNRENLEGIKRYAKQNGKEEKENDGKMYGRVFDKTVEQMMARNSVRNTIQKLEANPKNGEVAKEQEACNLLTGLRGNIIEPVVEMEPNDEILGGTRDAIRDHYRAFYFPGNIRYNRNKNIYDLVEPIGLSYDVQRMMMKKAYFSIGEQNVRFFEPGREGEIPNEELRNALKIYVSDRERNFYEKESSRKISAGPTWILYETLHEAGFFDQLKQKEKMEMMALAMFADIIEKGEWLDFVSDGFFDDREINLFKINRKLSQEQLAKIINSFLTGEIETAPENFDDMTARIQEIVVKKASQPFDEEFIKKQGLEELVKDQKYESRKAEEYLQSGKNSCRSRFGKIIFVTGFKDRLPGQLPAIDALPPIDDQTGKPAWKKNNGYFEANAAHLLGYLPADDFGTFLDQIVAEAERKGLNPQVSRINGWIKLFVPFKGAYDAELVNTLMHTWLNVAEIGAEESKTRKTPHFREKKKERVFVGK